MGKITVTVPDDIKKYVDNINRTLYVEALKEVARRNIIQEKKRIKQLLRKNEIYEKRYKMSYNEFSKKVPDTMKGHDDWIEWTYIINVYNELSDKISKLNILLNK